MSIVGWKPNALTSYRGSEQNAILHKNMYHLRDNSGNREYLDSLSHPKKSPNSTFSYTSSHKNKEKVVERIMNMRFPNISKYQEQGQIIEEKKESVRLNKDTRWVSQDVIDQEDRKGTDGKNKININIKNNKQRGKEYGFR